MGRNFVAASTQYLRASVTPPVTDVPLTFACWFKRSSAVNTTLMCFNDSALVNKRFLITIRNTNVVRIGHHDNTTSATADTTATASLNVWHHACGVFAADNNRTAYLDGGNSVNGTTNVTGSMSSLNQINVGILGGSTSSNYMQGEIAEVCVWNVALNAQEVAALGKGTNPKLIRPENLQLYYPLYGDASPEVNHGLGGSTYNLTLVNTPTTAAHPPVSPPNL